MQPNARVVLDSISPDSVRLTTLEVTMHRFILAEFNTHRVFSRNSASSRAIPVQEQVGRISRNAAYPVRWPREQPGMQGGADLEGVDLGDAYKLWDSVFDHTLREVENYIEAHPNKASRLHKSLINRLLEPFAPHTVIVTATEWQGFWDQRCSALAQPEMEVVAEAMRDAYDNSEPTLIPYGGWHTPYVTNREQAFYGDQRIKTLEQRIKVSVARCARVSYLHHDGTVNVNADLGLYNRLVSARPMHASPLEHVATPCKQWPNTDLHLGNFRGWDQWRHLVEAGAETNFYT